MRVDRFGECTVFKSEERGNIYFYVEDFYKKFRVRPGRYKIVSKIDYNFEQTFDTREEAERVAIMLYHFYVAKCECNIIGKKLCNVYRFSVQDVFDRFMGSKEFILKEFVVEIGESNGDKED